MHTTENYLLLSEQQAAEIIQPHMRNKSALSWLQHNRNSNAILPALVQDNGVFYKDRDLIKFITSSLNPHARFARTEDRLYNDRRYIYDRRSNKERRIKPDIALAEHIERRKPGRLDRRVFTLVNRRTTN